MPDSWRSLILAGEFQLCKCKHFAMKHSWDTGECYGVELYDESIRCDCRELELRPDLRVVE
jgi:hypothetical protein